MRLIPRRPSTQDSKSTVESHVPDYEIHPCTWFPFRPAVCRLHGMPLGLALASRTLARAVRSLSFSFRLPRLHSVAPPPVAIQRLRPVGVRHRHRLGPPLRSRSRVAARPARGPTPLCVRSPPRAAARSVFSEGRLADDASPCPCISSVDAASSGVRPTAVCGACAYCGRSHFASRNARNATSCSGTPQLTVR